MDNAECPVKYEPAGACSAQSCVCCVLPVCPGFIDSLLPSVMTHFCRCIDLSTSLIIQTPLPGLTQSTQCCYGWLIYKCIYEVEYVKAMMISTYQVSSLPILIILKF